ncbi:Pyridoxal phosphate homeostasis protein [bioreactor metagenome]|uniref:Pyridoxal phosphate homeostasis protein n=1 Tax=bioreactor metagenome TaxID=1076179 RepID=A0A644XMZ9_9ZZZZ
MTEIAKNIAEVRAEMARACERVNRSPESVTLVAVSKYQNIERIREAAEAGITAFGENHAQELNEKKTFFEQQGCRAHFIGQLQTNKIKYVCGFAGLVESIDRLSLAQAMQQKAEARGIVQDILIQVNIGEEEQKGGVTDGDLDCFAESIAGFSHLNVRGLMCVPPAVEAELARGYFRRMRALFEHMRQKQEFTAFDILSMGMSHDYPVAIEEGATEIRVGTGIFGARNQK